MRSNWATGQFEHIPKPGSGAFAWVNTLMVESITAAMLVERPMSGTCPPRSEAAIAAA